MNKPDYTAARLVFGFLSLVSSLGIAVGFFVVFAGFQSTRSLSQAVTNTMFLGGILLMTLSLFLLALVQVSRAVIDNARISWEILELMRRGQSAGSSQKNTTEPTKSKTSAESFGYELGKKLMGDRDSSDPNSESTKLNSVEVKGRSGRIFVGRQTDDGRFVFETAGGLRTFENLDEARDYFK